MSAAKRMSKEERRQQLLETASDIVRAEGTEALTLGYLAERAGVTKPIAYEHFGTRAGLLIALYKELDERQNRVMRAALEANGKTLEDVARIVSAAYVDCALTMGPEFGALSAALSATEEMEDFRQSVRDSCIAELKKAFAPFGKLSRGEGHALLEGLFGAAESLSQAAASGRTSRAQAVSALSRIMQGALE
ncbi:TetR/AcrR family transcriptional regulator [Pyxidicoccus trucidator]|uniref:TetR/AcrR family transcriptional regulator n=1 Tax=Pyxidicoccus trucidator TaxID=2709662 RepID=UPI001F07F2E4|nr:TetR/AcrR family transcriptional regulator [Pyxidicoccus trucidator]